MIDFLAAVASINTDLNEPTPPLKNDAPAPAKKSAPTAKFSFNIRPTNLPEGEPYFCVDFLQGEEVLNWELFTSEQAAQSAIKNCEALDQLEHELSKLASDPHHTYFEVKFKETGGAFLCFLHDLNDKRFFSFKEKFFSLFDVDSFMNFCDFYIHCRFGGDFYGKNH